MAGTLKEIAPSVTRAAVLRDPTARRDRPIRRHPVRGAVVGVEVSPVNVRDATEIERVITTFARTSNGGLIVTARRCRVFIAH